MFAFRLDFSHAHFLKVFEYMSGCELSTPTGSMEGCFHMASVDVKTTQSAQVGDHVEALIWHSNHPQKFVTPVRPFGLVADEDVEQ